jgi:hypothetical protein
LLARHDIGDRLRKGVRTFLIEQAGDLPAALGRLVNSFSLFTPQNFSADRAIAHQHCHVIDGSVRRKWKRINCFDLFLEGVAKLLSHHNSGKEAADFSFNGGLLERT